MRSVILGVLVLFAAEIYVLLRLNEAIGAASVLGLLVGAAVLGYYVARAQGLAVGRRWLAAAASGVAPEEGLVDGLLVLAGGVLLALPGVISDALGVLLLVPPIRRFVAERIRRRAATWVPTNGSVKVSTFDGRVWSSTEQADADPDVDAAWRVFGGGRATRDAGVRQVIDVEGVVVEERATVEARPERLLGAGALDEGAPVDEAEVEPRAGEGEGAGLLKGTQQR